MHSRLRDIARTYVWWKSPDETLQDSSYFLGHVMNLGTWDDVMDVFEAVGKAAFIEALRLAPSGIMSKKSWNFWHVWLDVPIKPYPDRRVG